MNEVQDKPTEVGIKLNNILTALVLMVMSWAGYNIQALKDTVYEVREQTSITQNNVEHLEYRLEEHIRHAERRKK